MTEGQVDRRIASGEWEVVRRGWFRLAGGAVDPGRPSGADPGQAASALMAAARALPGRELVASHLSAAQVWGLSPPLDGWPEPTFTARSGATRYRGGRTVFVAPLPDEHVCSRPVLGITTAARTVADCLRVLPGHDGLAMLDQALRLGLTTLEQVEAVVRFQAGWQGVRTARGLLGLADHRRESALESWSAWGFDQVGVPPPAWQVNLFDAAGAFLGRVDGWWPCGVVGEADGRMKYRLEAARRGGATPEVLAGILDDERERESRIRAAGADVQRWGAVDILDRRRREALGTRLRSALDLATRHPRFTGLATPT